MKKLSKNIKYFITGVFVLVAGFAFANNTYAWSYTALCSDGVGLVNTSVTLTPSITPGSGSGVGTFPANSGAHMVASSIVSTGCTSELIRVTVENNTGGEIEIIPPTTISPGNSAISFSNPPLPIPATANNASNPFYYVHFKTGVDQPANQPIFVRLRRETVSGPSVQSCNQGQGTYMDGPVVTAFVADFYASMADYNANIPLDVTGRNLKLKINYWSATGSFGLLGNWGTYVPNTTTYTPILSGTSSYIYGTPPNSGLWTENFVAGQFVPEDCEYFWFGGTADLTILEGLSETVPYATVDFPRPSVVLDAPAGVYTGDSYNLTWNVSGADSCSATNFSNSGTMSGSLSFTMGGTVSYTLTCSNLAGISTVTKTVEDLGVYSPPPTCNAYPGNAIQCLPPSFCASDPMNPGYEVCQF